MRRFLVIAVLIIPAPCLAQFYAHPLFVEAARDPGIPASASPRSVALGGQSGAGTADAAMLAPSAMLMAGGPQISLWGGTRGYRRTEALLTPALLSSDPQTRESARHYAPLFGVVVANRGERWAAAGFIQTESTTHQFTTDENRLSQFFAHGSASWVDGTGAASVDIDMKRFGAALAVSPVRRVSIGASVYVVRLRHLVDADLRTTACGFLAGMPTECGPELDDRAYSQVVGTNTGAALSASVGDERFSVTGRWNYEPTMLGVRTSFETRMNLPDTFAVGARGSFANTIAMAEIARERRADVFPEHPDAPEYCALARIPDCPGWGFGEHEVPDATAVRAGIEQRVAQTPLTVLLGYATSPSRIVALAGERGPDDTARLHRLSGGVSWRAGARNAIDIALARDRYELAIVAGYRFSR